MIVTVKEIWVGADQARRAEFEDAVMAHADGLFAVAYSILRDAGDAEDAVQSAMEKAWTRWDSLREPGARPGWLRTICVRQCLRSRRRLSDQLSPGLADTTAQHRPDMDVERALRRRYPRHGLRRVLPSQ